MIDVSDGNAIYYYHFDGLGSVVALSDVNNVIVESYSYDVFGEPNTTSSIGNPYMFTGRRYDSETANYYCRARIYKPSIGRFLQPDPIGYEGGINIYSYCANNPVIYKDPLGLDYWIEGPSAGEPSMHQSLAVGDPLGNYVSFSFGVNGNKNLYHGLEGVVYEDKNIGGNIDDKYYRKTTQKEDAGIIKALNKLVDVKGAYLLGGTCRNFSQEQFKHLDELNFGQKANPTRPKVKGVPSSSIGLSSSVVLTEPYGPISSSSNSCKK